MSAAEHFTRPGMRAGVIDGLLVNVNGNLPITDETWNAYLDWVAGALIHQPNPPILTFSPDVSPSAKQRQRMVERSRELGLFAPRYVVLISDSIMVRGAMTAISWLSGTDVTVKALSPKRWRESFEILHQFAQPSQDHVQTMLHRWLSEVGYTAAHLRQWQV